jgi:hypothetical protein
MADYLELPDGRKLELLIKGSNYARYGLVGFKEARNIYFSPYLAELDSGFPSRTNWDPRYAFKTPDEANHFYAFLQDFRCRHLRLDIAMPLAGPIYDRLRESGSLEAPPVAALGQDVQMFLGKAGATKEGERDPWDPNGLAKRDLKDMGWLPGLPRGFGDNERIAEEQSQKTPVNDPITLGRIMNRTGDLLPVGLVVRMAPIPGGWHPVFWLNSRVQGVRGPIPYGGEGFYTLKSLACYLPHSSTPTNLKLRWGFDYSSLPPTRPGPETITEAWYTGTLGRWLKKVRITGDMLQVKGGKINFL